jgi:hypothetical protein
MNIEQFEPHIVINEWQLGQQLNTAVHTGARDKFNLLLSFLSEDARDFAQFEIVSPETKVDHKIDLRAYFELPTAQPLVNEGPSASMLAELNNDLQNKNLTAIRLKQLLINEALLSKKEAGVLPDDILDNLPLLKQQRVQRAYQANLPEVLDDKTIATGIDVALLDEYQQLDLANRPLKVHYTHPNK